MVLRASDLTHLADARKYYDDCAQILTEHMLAALKPKAKVSFSALAPLLATMEDPIDPYAPRGGLPRKRNKKNGEHQRAPSIADRVKMILMEENEDEEAGHAEEENDKLSDLQGSEHLHGSDDGSHGSVGLDYEDPVDYITNPVRNLPDQLATEPASSASIVPSGNSSLADLDDLSITGGKDTRGVVTTTHQEELRCVITIIRHGDRTPKEKIKAKVSDKHYLQYFHNHTQNVKKDLKIKAKKHMVSISL